MLQEIVSPALGIGPVIGSSPSSVEQGASVDTSVAPPCGTGVLSDNSSSNVDGVKAEYLSLLAN
jgi:hypothetical protein